MEVVMDKELVFEIIERLKTTDVSVLEYECDEYRIKIERGSKTIAPKFTVVDSESFENTQQTETNTTKGNVIKAPIVGTLYLSPSPDAQPFVSKGKAVKKGDVVCIIEAMKVMNEIESEFDGEIADILAPNGTAVEYGQPLISVK